MKNTMDLSARTPPATEYKPLALSTFGNTNLTLVSHKPISSSPDFQFPTTFSDATPTEWGQQTNKSIMYHYSAKAKDLDQYGPGAVIFMFRSPRLLGLDCPDRSKRVADIFELNKWFNEIEDHPGNQKYRDQLSSVDDVLFHIKFAGVLKNAMTNSTRERNLGTAVMNNVVGERASTVNLWGSSAREGTPLHVIVKRERNTKTGKFPWKIVPCAGHGPQLTDLVYTHNGVEKVGGSIFIGTAISSPTINVEGNENAFDNPEKSRRLQGWTGGVDVCLGV